MAKAVWWYQGFFGVAFKGIRSVAYSTPTLLNAAEER